MPSPKKTRPHSLFEAQDKGKEKEQQNIEEDQQDQSQAMLGGGSMEFFWCDGEQSQQPLLNPTSSADGTTGYPSFFQACRLVSVVPSYDHPNRYLYNSDIRHEISLLPAEEESIIIVFVVIVVICHHYLWLWSLVRCLITGALSNNVDGDGSSNGDGDGDGDGRSGSGDSDSDGNDGLKMMATATAIWGRMAYWVT
ncbi:hypothetical protein QOT17_023787 [Balamuthia mandrillaris]